MAFTIDQIAYLKTLLEVQADGYKDSIDRLYKDYFNYRKEQEKEMQEIKLSLEFTQKENDDLKVELKKIKFENEKGSQEINILKEKFKLMESQLMKCEENVDYIDDKQRKCNLIVSGLEEIKNENSEQCHNKTSKFLTEKLNMPDIEIVAAHRIGKPEKRNRDILVKFKNQTSRDAVFKEKKCLKGQNVYINEDFCRNTVDARKMLIPKLREARSDGKTAFINYRQLIVKSALDISTRKSKPNTAVVQETVQHYEALSPLPSPLRQSNTPTRTSTASASKSDDLGDGKTSLQSLRPRSNLKYGK